MKQFCGQGKKEPLSCWSNSEHPLTIIHRVVCDSWRSKALENNRIREIFVLLFIPSLAAATNFAVGIKISQHHSDLLFEKNGALECYHRFSLLSGPKQVCGGAPVIPAKAMTLTSETRGSLVAGHPGFPGIWRARESVSWTSHRTTLAFPIINFTQATNPPL